MRAHLRGALVALVLALPGGSLGAQETARLPVAVDYVNADGVYMPIGSDAGLAAGDTLTAFTAASGAGPGARFLLSTVTRRRSVARVLDGPVPAVGDTLWLELAVAAPATEAEIPGLSAGLPGAAASLPAGGPARSSTTAAAVRSADFSGRLSLDVVGRESRTSWTGDLAGGTTRRYATPTTRLSLLGRDLPGGLELRVSARASYRYTSDFVGPPPTSVRVYEMAVTRQFERAPVRITAGRFVNPYERYSGFWDGLLLRVGGRTGLGAGVVAGFEPSQGNEAPASDVTKITGFVDFAARGAGWRYDTDVSVHLVRPSAGVETRSLGWTQSLRAGPLTLSQRALLDAASEGRDARLRQLRAQAGLALGGGFRLRGAYSHRAADWFPVLDTLDADLLLAPTLGARDEVTVGLGVSGAGGSLWVDGGRSELEGSDPGRTLSVRSSVRLGSGSFYASGRIYRNGPREALSASPGLGFRLFGGDLRAAYRFYRTSSGTTTLVTHAVDATLRANLARGLGLSLGLGEQWGANLGGTTVRLGLWRSF